MSRSLWPRAPLALRLALRELRGGLAGFRVFLACLALGVAAIAAVGSLRAAIDAGLAREAATMLGGDAEVEFAYRFADPDERAWMAGRAAAVSEIVDFRSLAGTAGGARTLVQVKAVDGGYPLVGALTLAGGGGLDAALAPAEGRPGLVAERILVDRLGLAVGDPVTLGTTTFRLADVVESIPDAAPGVLAFGPRVVVRRADLADSGLLAEGALFDSSYRLLLRPGADLAALATEARARFGDRGLQWRDRREGPPGVGRLVDRLADFLVLLGLAGLAVGGIGVAAAVRAHLAARVTTIATLRTLGAGGGTVFAVYLIEVGLVAAVGTALGLALGAALPLLAAPLAGPRLPVPAVFGLYPRPLAEAALYGALTALTFALWPLGRVRDIRPAALYRDEPVRAAPRAGAALATLAAALLLVGAATAFSGAPRLALGVAGGVVAALGLLALAARTGSSR